MHCALLRLAIGRSQTSSNRPHAVGVKRQRSGGAAAAANETQAWTATHMPFFLVTRIKKKRISF